MDPDKVHTYRQPKDALEISEEALAEVEKDLQPLLFAYVESVVADDRGRVIEGGIKIMGVLVGFYLTLHEFWVGGKLRDSQVRSYTRKLHQYFDKTLDELFQKNHMLLEGKKLKFGAMGEAATITILQKAFSEGARSYQCSEEADKHGADVYLDITFHGKRVCLVAQVKLLKAGNNLECQFFDESVAERWGIPLERMLRITKDEARRITRNKAQVAIPIYIGLPMSPNHQRTDVINHFSSLPGEAMPDLMKEKILGILEEHIQSPELQL